MQHDSSYSVVMNRFILTIRRVWRYSVCTAKKVFLSNLSQVSERLDEADDHGQTDTHTHKQTPCDNHQQAARVLSHCPTPPSGLQLPVYPFLPARGPRLTSRGRRKVTRSHPEQAATSRLITCSGRTWDRRRRLVLLGRTEKSARRRRSQDENDGLARSNAKAQTTDKVVRRGIH